MDWSQFPLIATFFATNIYLPAKQVGTKSASIWVVDAIKLIVAPPLNANVVEPILRPAIKDGKETNKVIAAMAVESDSRMQVQQRAFTVHNTDRPLNKMDGSDKWLHDFIVPLDDAKRNALRVDIIGVKASY